MASLLLHARGLQGVCGSLVRVSGRIKQPAATRYYRRGVGLPAARLPVRRAGRAWAGEAGETPAVPAGLCPASVGSRLRRSAARCGAAGRVLRYGPAGPPLRRLGAVGRAATLNAGAEGGMAR